MRFERPHAGLADILSRAWCARSTRSGEPLHPVPARLRRTPISPPSLARLEASERGEGIPRGLRAALHVLARRRRRARWSAVSNLRHRAHRQAARGRRQHRLWRAPERAPARARHAAAAPHARRRRARRACPGAAHLLRGPTPGSVATIVACGGQVSTREQPVEARGELVQRYWIALAPMSLGRRAVELSPYSPMWPAVFDIERERLAEHLRPDAGR